MKFFIANLSNIVDRYNKKAGDGMNKYNVQLEVPEGEVQKVLDRLTAAQQEIYNCYTELENLGVLVVRREDGKERTASGN